MDFAIGAARSLSHSFLSSAVSFAQESPLITALVSITAVGLVLSRKTLWRWGVTHIFLNAVIERDWILAHQLLEKGADVNVEVGKGFFPLHHAVTMQREEVVGQLIRFGADVDVEFEEKRYRPLHFAVWEGNLNIVRRLIAARANLNAKDYLDDRPIHQAAFRGHWDIVRVLLKAGADWKGEDGGGITLFVRAAEAGEWEIAITLAEAGADLSARGVTHQSALTVAAEAGDARVGKLLLEKGAERALTGNPEVDQRIEAWQKEIEFPRWFAIISNLSSTPLHLIGRTNPPQPVDWWERTEMLCRE